MNTVVGLFDHYKNADWAIEVLQNYDVDSDRISIVALDKAAIERGLAATDGLVGLLADASASAFAFIVPEVGPVIATGTLAITLFTNLDAIVVGAHMGAAASGLLGVLGDLGFPKETAEFYIKNVKEGGILVAVESGLQDEYRIRAVLRGAGAVAIDVSTEALPEERQNTFNELESAYEEAYQH
jgi:hypothetical protein